MRQSLLASVAAVALGSAGTVLLAASPALADSLTPSSFTASIGVGGHVNIDNKLGVISAGSPTTAQADVLFITDTTGSMTGGIDALKTEFNTVISSLNALGSIATGTAQYKDMTGAGDAFDYQLNQDITTTNSQTQTAISGYTASGGGDTPEQGLNALQQGATTTTWRSGSKRIAVITGDAPSHSSPGHPPAANGANVANTASTLTTNGVTMVAIDANGITHGDGGLDAYGQFTGLLGSGVSGSFFASVPDATTLANDLIAAIGSAFASYSTVSLNLIAPPDPGICSVTLPGSFSGSFDRSVTRSFGFGAVGITGLNAGICSFTIALEADGAILATELDTIKVGAVPEPSTIALLATGVLGLGGVLRRRRKS